MLKAIGTIQLAIAPLFVIPAVTAQEGMNSKPINGISLQAQLDSTIASIEYLTGLRAAALAGDDAAVRAIITATEAPRAETPERQATITSLQDNLAGLRFQLDRLLSDPGEVAAITAMPMSVVKTLGLGGSSTSGSTDSMVTMPKKSALPSSSGPVPVTAGSVRLPGTTPFVGQSTGLDAVMRKALTSDVAALDPASESSRRRGAEGVSLEEKGYVADPIHLGKLLVRAGRPAEAVEILKKHQTGPSARYWLARGLQSLDRETEAIALYRLLADDPAAGIHSRHAAQDLKFLEFKSALEKK